MDNEVRPLRVWNDGELCEYDTVTVGNRRLVVVRQPRLENRPWALPGGFSDAEGIREEIPPREAGYDHGMYSDWRERDERPGESVEGHPGLLFRPTRW
jgi:hypothetical protein